MTSPPESTTTELWSLGGWFCQALGLSADRVIKAVNLKHLSILQIVQENSKTSYTLCIWPYASVGDDGLGTEMFNKRNKTIYDTIQCLCFLPTEVLLCANVNIQWEKFTELGDCLRGFIETSELGQAKKSSITVVFRTQTQEIHHRYTH